MSRKMTAFFLLVLLLVACSPPEAPEVQFGDLEKSDGYTLAPPIQEEIRVRNCDNPLERKDTLTEVKTIERVVTWNIEGRAGIEAGAGVIIADGKVQAEISSGYELEVSDQLQRGREHDLPVSPYSSVIYVIEWQPIVWSGYLPFEMQSGTERIEYQYKRIAFGEVKDIIDYTAEDCLGRPTVSPNPPQETVIPTPTSIPTTATPTSQNIDFLDWQVPAGHNTYTEYRKCPQYPNDIFPDFSLTHPGYILLNPQAASLNDGAYTWCFQVRTVLDTAALEAQYFPDYSSAGYGDLESMAVYFCAAPAQGFCVGQELMPEGSAVTVDNICTLSPVVGSANGISTKQERTIRIALPLDMEKSPTIILGPYPVGNPPYITCVSPSTGPNSTSIVAGIPRQQVEVWNVDYVNRDVVYNIIYNEVHKFPGRISFGEDDTIPKGVLITSDLGRNWDRYPLRRLAHDGGGWGVFESQDSFVVIHADDLDHDVGGEYWYINE